MGGWAPEATMKNKRQSSCLQRRAAAGRSPWIRSSLSERAADTRLTLQLGVRASPRLSLGQKPRGRTQALNQVSRHRILGETSFTKPTPARPGSSKRIFTEQCLSSGRRPVHRPTALSHELRRPRGNLEPPGTGGRGSPKGALAPTSTALRGETELCERRCQDASWS